jgi:hypothetical protein
MAQEPRPSARQPVPASGAPRNPGEVPSSEKGADQDLSRQTNLKSQPLYLPSDSEMTTVDGQLSVHSVALAEVLGTCESVLDGLLSKTHEIHKQSWSAVQSLFKDLHLRLCQECEAATSAFEKEIHERARFETLTLLEIVDVEAKSRLAACVDGALEKTREAERRDQQERDEKLEAGRENLRETTESATRELQRQKAECLESFHLEAETTRRVEAGARQRFRKGFHGKGRRAQRPIRQVHGNNPSGVSSAIKAVHRWLDQTNRAATFHANRIRGRPRLE